jgi:hypothetical protein
LTIAAPIYRPGNTPPQFAEGQVGGDADIGPFLSLSDGVDEQFRPATTSGTMSAEILIARDATGRPIAYRYTWLDIFGDIRTRPVAK